MRLSELPNPKRLTRNRRDWYGYYAGFSPLFAKAVLEAADLASDDLVVDPWNGAGTTTWTACLLGFKAAGFDLNPVMVEISRGRALAGCQKKTARLAVSRMAAALPIARKDDPLLVWFSPAASRTIRGIADSCESEVNLALRGFLFTSLFNTVRFLTRPFRSSNPTWMKQPPNGGLKIRTADIVSQFTLEAEQFLNRPLVDWPLCGNSPPAIELKDAVSLPLRDASVGMVLTSPPYCTRIDYVQNTLVELAVMGISADEAASLRDRMAGTPTIRTCPEQVIAEWGPSCRALLDAVYTHQSKSSASYYWKTLTQYFGDLRRGIREAARYLRPNGAAVFVVQDSLYKELHIDLARIVTEMTEPFGWILKQRIDYSSRRTMRSVNTRSRAYQARTECVESVLCFETGR